MKIKKTHNFLEFHVISMFFNALIVWFWQEEHEGIRAKKSESEPLEWSDYKSMPFTQCVSSSINM